MARDRTATEHVDVLVVGSGFGGSVAADRLARAGLGVVVMERGRDYPPGSFARTPAQAARAFWAPETGSYGLFDVRSFRHFDSVVASGLGGGSLIYANVLLRKDEHWFVDRQQLPGGGYESWPVTRADLDPHYDAVERVLTPTPYPLEHPGYDDVPKARAMRTAADRLGLEHFLPPLAVSFAPEPGARPGIGLPVIEPDHGNLHGVTRRTCRLCGECNIGCNEGAKNSLDFTYLSTARQHGADLRTGHEVRAIRPAGRGGYEVDYVRHGPDRDGHVRRGPDSDSGGSPADRVPVRTLHCDRLVLAAGTYGTSGLLLRSHRQLPGIGAALGTRFSGNGDILSFAVRTKDGHGARPSSVDPSRGPVITSTIRLPDDDLDGQDHSGFAPAGRGAYIQDGGYPSFVGWLVEAAGLPRDAGRAGRFLLRQLAAHTVGDPDATAASLAGLLDDGALSDSSLPLLGMGRDTPDGVLVLRRGTLDAEWSTAGSAQHYARLRAALRAVSEALGGRYADSPHWLLKRIITVHPCGGAPMGRNQVEGVCDEFGEVYGHPGLYVMDAAALPGPVGTNPALTVAALADRACTRLLEKRDSGAYQTSGAEQVSDVEEASDVPAPPGVPARVSDTYTPHSSVQFTETMTGYCAMGVSDPRTARRSPAREPLRARLTLTIDDIDAFLARPEHPARADGWIEARGLGGRRPVTGGEVHVFGAGRTPDHRELRYRLFLTDDTGAARTLIGVKDLAPAGLDRLWPATTTLPYVLLEGHLPQGRLTGDEDRTEGMADIVAAGTLRISPPAFLRQLTTFRTTGPRAAATLARFHAFFLDELRRLYGPTRLLGRG
ncbi:GMC oxidoreductase [Streptomyces kanamyceticus]|uniref:Cholesterol oxidase n=1 Tax=Streptomyces kanamyceticus TaxID=1967 RepID=A0A5J6GQN5_STRKN|nr:GMC family oxidoreductase [Streptomyces kanamyceticus]QEU96722.1 GMC family oxidoreductase [Streptomyces kanamyceticus]